MTEFESLLSLLEPTLVNATQLSSIVMVLEPDEEAVAQEFITRVLSGIEPTELSQRDLVSYLKLWVKYRQPKPLQLEDFLTHEQLTAVQQLR